MTTGLDAARAVAPHLEALGGAWLVDSNTRATGKELGFRGFSYYFGGRGGVLGDVDADVVTAALTFFPSYAVRPMWELAGQTMDRAEHVRRYAGSCHDWGREHLSQVHGAERLSELSLRVVDAADPAGAPLFAGWRALPRPDDVGGRLAHAMHLLREHRGALHAIAVLAQGLTPLQAVVSGPYGPGNAEYFGWRAPYPDAKAHVAARTAAEDRTDLLVARAYDVLEGSEEAELADLTVRAAAALR